MRRHAAWIWIAVLGASCASAVPQQPPQLARADAELRQGCYDCLLAARVGYRALGGADRPALTERLFEADLLIALREKELDLPASDALAEARRLATALPPDLQAGRIVALVDGLPGSPPGGSRRAALLVAARFALTPAERDQQRAWLGQIALRAEVRRYLQLALECAALVPGRTAPAASPAAADPPLVAYRRATCELGAVAELIEVRRREPRFVEASLFLAGAELASATPNGPGQAEAHLAEVLARFPASPAAHDLAGDARLLLADPAAALAHYDRALALAPGHEQAWLGRIISLTDLGRHRDAIEAATRLLAIDPGSQGNAYYWRARNHHELHELTDARADITAAREVVVTADVLGLAGVIEYEQADLDPAEADLTAAIRAAGDCTPRWYLGLVLRQRRQWLPAGHAFEDAMGCFRERARDSASRLAALQARSDVDPAYRERVAASLTASIDADAKQQHLAALMAASQLAAAGDVVAARPLADLAGEDPALADPVTRLRTRLGADPHAEH